MTPRRPIGARHGGEVSQREPLRFPLVAWESYVTPSRTAKHFCIAICIRVNSSLSKFVMGLRCLHGLLYQSVSSIMQFLIFFKRETLYCLPFIEIHYTCD